VGNGPCVVAIGLDRHSGGGAFHPPGLDADRWQPHGTQSRVQPWRQWAGLEPEAGDHQSGGREPSDQIGRIRRRLTFDDDGPILVDDTDGRLLKRDIQAGEMLHGILLMMAWAQPYCRADLPLWRPC